MARMSRISPAVAVTDPTMSSGSSDRSLRLSASVGRVATSVTATTGRFSRKIHRHPQAFVITPPPTIPATKPSPAIAP
jgi:hypothetical protein